MSLPIDNLSKKDYNNFSKIAKSYVISIKMLKVEVMELRMALKPYYNQPNNTN